MARAVSCASGRGAEARPSRGDSSFFGEPIDNAFLGEPFCGSLGCEDAPADFTRPFRSDVPALLITGSLDRTTPLPSTEMIRTWWPQALTLEVGNAGHETLPIPIVQDAVVSFLRDGRIASPHVTVEPPHPTSIAEAKKSAGRSRR
jgi:hypothetical protein